MPHITIEHSKCIDEKIEGGNFKVAGCKARSISFDKYYVAGKNQQTTSFCHVTIKILEGRSDEIKAELAQTTAEFTKKALENRDNLKEQNDLSVDIVDLDKKTYQKTLY